jgi:hypothetical protein
MAGMANNIAIGVGVLAGGIAAAIVYYVRAFIRVGINKLFDVLARERR